MLPIRPPSTPPQNHLRLSGDDPATSTQARPSSQVVPEPLPTSVSVGNLTFHTGEVKTPLSELEKRILCFALHSQTPKELGKIDEKNHLFTYAFGPNDYFPDRHLPRNLNLPEKMQAICALDPSLNRLNLRRVIITDLKNPEHVLCDASYELPITKEAASPPGSTARPALSPPAALLTAHAQFSDAARGNSSLAAAGGALKRKKRKPATNDEIREHLWAPKDRARTKEEVVAALHAANLGAHPKRITPLLQAARGVLRLPPASDDLLSEQLMNPDGTGRTEQEVVAALHDLGKGVGATRLTTQLKRVRGVLNLPPASDDLLSVQRRNPDGTGRTAQQIIDAVHDLGFGIGNDRLSALRRKEMPQPAATGSQAGEE